MSTLEERVTAIEQHLGLNVVPLRTTVPEALTDDERALLRMLVSSAWGQSTEENLRKNLLAIAGKLT